MHTVRAFVVVLAASLLLAGCGSNDETPGGTGAAAGVGGGSGGGWATGGVSGNAANGGTAGTSSGGSSASAGSAGSVSCGSAGSEQTGHEPAYVSTVGGGPMPDWTVDVTSVADYGAVGDGTTDDTAAIQAAANAARDQNRKLIFPYTPEGYRITSVLYVYTSIATEPCAGGKAKIFTTNTGTGWDTTSVIRLSPGVDNRWIYNIHLVGTFTGSESDWEFAHCLDLGPCDGLTIQDNIFESPRGDCISTDWTRFATNYSGSRVAKNVLVRNNQLVNPRRCGVGFVWHADNWVVIDNVIDKNDATGGEGASFVSGIDIEPEHDADNGGATVTNIEIAYNEFIMNNGTVNPNRWADGKATFAWGVPDNTNPGGNYFLHHNYGTFGTGFWDYGGPFYNIVNSSNAEGSAPPQP